MKVCVNCGATDEQVVLKGARDNKNICMDHVFCEMRAKVNMLQDYKPRDMNDAIVIENLMEIAKYFLELD